MTRIKRELLHYLLILCFGLNILEIHAQISSVNKGFLDYYYEQKDWACYVAELHKYLDDTLVSNNAQLIKSLEEDFLRIQKFEVPALIRRKALSYYAYLWKNIGKNHTALTYYLKAHELVEDKFCLDRQAWSIENPIFNIYIRFGDHERAKYFFLLMENNLRYLKDQNNLSRLYKGESIRLREIGQLELAKQYGIKGIEIAQKNKFHQGVFTNLESLLYMYINERNKDSIEIYINLASRSLDSLTKNSSYQEYRSSLHHKVARFHALNGDTVQCLEYLKMAIVDLFVSHETDTGKREFAKLYREIGEMYRASGQLDSAELYYTKGITRLQPNYVNLKELPKQQELFHENTFVELLKLKYLILADRAMINKNPTDLNDAILYNRLSLGLNLEMIQNVKHDDPKLILIKDSKQMLDDGFNYVNRLQEDYGVVLPDSLVRYYFDHSKGLLVSQKLENKIAYEQFTKQQKLEFGALINKLNDIEQDAVHAVECFEIRTQMDKLLRNSKQTYFQETIPDNYIEYAYQSDKIYRYYNLTGIQHFDCIGTKDSFLVLQQEFNKNILTIETPSKNDIYQKLFSYLMPLDIQLPSQVTIIPDGPIAFVPFEALKENNITYVIESTEIIYNLKFKTIIYKESNASNRLIALSPAYPKQDFAAITRGGSYALKYADNEIQTIYTNIQKLNGDIGVKDLKEHLQNARLFHFAGHASVEEETSALHLSNQDQKLRYKDITALYNNLDLVVLSACETGLGKWDPGDGARSLNKAFLESGTKSVVSSLWSIQDNSAYRIMQNFYQGLIKGDSKSSALRQAKLSYLRESNLDAKHPYYWAALLPYGDVQSPMNLESSNYLLIIGVIILLLLTTYYLFFKSKTYKL